MKINLKEYHQQWVDKSNSKNAYLEVFWIIQSELNVAWSVLHHQKTYTQAQLQPLDIKLARYVEGEPLAYVIGKVDFLGKDIEIVPGVLIPRPATADLVVILQDYITDGDKIIELGVGSGAVSCSLAKRFPASEVVGVERESVAYALAEKNVKAFGLSNLQLLKQSWLDPLPVGFNVCFSNPPYIGVQDPYLDDSVRNYEPKSSWCSEDNGYKDPCEVIQVAKKILQPSGLFMLEHGFSQQDQLAEYARNIGFSIIQMVQDEQGLPRGLLMQLES